MLPESTRLRPGRPAIKDCWHLYSLQNLTPNRFANVVGNILRGRHELVTTRDNRVSPAGGSTTEIRADL